MKRINISTLFTRAFALTITLSFISSVPVYASSGANTAHSGLFLNDSICRTASESEVSSLGSAIAGTSRAVGDYEPNNNFDTAFPYENTRKIACDHGNWPYGHYNCFFTPNTLESPDDVDYFRVKTQPGGYYAVVLKNVWTDHVRDIRVYYRNTNGTMVYTEPTSKKDGQSIFHVLIPGEECYIRITGSAAPGHTFDNSPNWFAMELDGRIDERAHVGDPKPYCSLQ